MEINREMLEKAGKLHTVEELMTLARENGMELTEETAKSYLRFLHPQEGEIADEELDNVSGGGCERKPKDVGTFTNCRAWIHEDDGGHLIEAMDKTRTCSECGCDAYCFECKYFQRIETKGYCTWQC